MKCSVNGCEKAAVAKGLCDRHYVQDRKTRGLAVRTRRPCSVDGCTRAGVSGGLCQMHKLRVIKTGETGPPDRIGPLIGRRYEKSDGYVFIMQPDHPNAESTGYVREHVLAMVSILGRPLRKGERVHHKNGVRDDNRPENLELWGSGHPEGQRVADRLSFYLDFIQRYAGAGPFAEQITEGLARVKKHPGALRLSEGVK